ncbi:MAG: hypothetical protein P4L99_26980 [Chthoniobacter sp.]|nr:hypothetical protein [Chthoniobacter sp.]
MGAALIADDVVVPVELGLIPFSRKHTFMSRLTKEARRINGHARWQKNVHEAVALLRDIFWPADTVIGGGNAKVIDPLPPQCRRTSNREAILGAVRLWGRADFRAEPYGTTWRVHREAEAKARPRKSTSAKRKKKAPISRA